ncbi:hypothetical protein DRP04_12825 [Archaeoglobales archaeon]|nr:MAG: hypothetical protein DRP04_12825 [Archaeoglobales archaeon]
MPWGWGGRGWRWGFWMTGLPGWMRFSYWYPAAWQGVVWPGWSWFWRCRWFPWLPRWWWTGMYGPIEWTPYGPQLVSSTSQPAQPTSPQTMPVTGEQELRYLEQELKALEEERRAIEEEIKAIRERINELRSKK